MKDFLLGGLMALIIMAVVVGTHFFRTGVLL
jgi:hypothetical protein